MIVVVLCCIFHIIFSFSPLNSTKSIPIRINTDKVSVYERVGSGWRAVEDVRHLTAAGVTVMKLLAGGALCRLVGGVQEDVKILSICNFRRREDVTNYMW